MIKYKICPSCKTKNKPTLFECINCETDLTNVKITDIETENMLKENVTTQSPVTIKWVRICECGAKNPSNARKCSSCNEDISDITPTPEGKEQKTSITFILSSLDGQYVYQMTSNEIIIGRENIMGEYLSTKSYVSRSQAKLSIKNNEMFIENMSNTNFTYINNKKIIEKTKLQDGDEIGLGGMNINNQRQAEAAYFLVRMKPCM